MSQDVRSLNEPSYRRCHRACSRCRDMKVRCSGTVPCMRCRRKRKEHECHYAPENARVTVSSSYIESLEARVRDGENRPRTPPGRLSQATIPRSTRFNPFVSSQLSGQDLTRGRSRIQEQADTGAVPTHAPGEDLSPDASEFSRNPLADQGEVFARDPGGKFWYIGPTSSWAFCRRVLAIVGNHTPWPEAPVHPWDLENIDFSWTPIGLTEQPDVTGLPSYDHALYMLASVEYNLATLDCIIDYVSFRENLEIFYEDLAATAMQNRLWYSQFLLVLAFGESFTSTGPATGKVPGIDYASRALSLIPNLVPMNGKKDSLAVVQAHCLAALYLQAIDLRLMAFQMIGQGLRLAIIEGWHRHMAPHDVGDHHARRCNTVFWACYIIDQEFGPLVGAPSSIRIEDVTARLPSDIDGSLKAEALGLQVRQSRLTATMVAGVYGVDDNIGSTLLSDTQSVLYSLAGLSEDISLFLESRLHGMDVRSSKIATGLMLSYHHCVVLTTRPLVMCVLQRRVLSRDPSQSIPDGPVRSLLQSCVHSALNILGTLRTLGDSDLLDSFLPFQMETVFSSAFLLYVIDSVSPGFVSDQTWLATALGILDMMIARGSPAAPLRKRELQRLEQAMTSYLSGSTSHGSASPSQGEERAGTLATEEGIQANEAGLVDDDLSLGFLAADGGLAMSPGEMMHLAEGLRMEDFVIFP